MSNSFYHTISDNQWKIIEPHLPKAKSTGRPGLNTLIPKTPPPAFPTINLHDFDKELYKARNIVERFFQRIKTFRHDKLSDCFLNFVFLAAVIIQF